MRASFWFPLWVAAGMLATASLTLSSSRGAPSGAIDVRKQMNETFHQGNFKDAYEGFRKLALDPQDDPAAGGRRPEHGRPVSAAAQSRRRDRRPAGGRRSRSTRRTGGCCGAPPQNYMSIPHYGFIVAGKFYRGNQRGGGKRGQRHRARPRPRPATDGPGDAAGPEGRQPRRGGRLSALAGRHAAEQPRLQRVVAAAISDRPEQSCPTTRTAGATIAQTAGAPVDADGKPVFYHVPKSFEAAENDGQRWRWCLQQAVEFNPQRLNAVRMQFAEFLLNQFGVQTMAQ